MSSISSSTPSSKPEKVRDARARQVKDAILEAAIEVFAEKGFDGAAISEIAAVSGAKQTLIVYHFGSKDALWESAAARLMAQFDEVQTAHFQHLPNPRDDRERLLVVLTSFIQALRQLPAYGKLLLREGSRSSQRMLWLDHHYIPKVYRAMAFEDPALMRVFGTVNLLRYAVAGAVLFIVVAGPQIAVSAAEQGGDAPTELYPLSDALLERLAAMLCDFVFQQLHSEFPASGAVAATPAR
jgi:AcrR family transcriptional regulator